ncbi:lymphotactin isoform X2 [Microcaecilia unicolor]|uniref:Lymphotactin-like isoform X2 n=1 Tax=Microcaecilia unicolor TaxID=1415580 RepID=A0A6P7X734_9AMPH|nr:lymphotactin-like isoform X2 [Microcaecilia unicolor]
MKLAMSVLVCFILYTVSTIKGPGGHQVKIKSCTDIKSNKPLNVKRISRFIHQKTPIAAIMFITNRNIMICVDPKLEWVQLAIKTINSRKTSRRRPKN